MKILIELSAQEEARLLEQAQKLSVRPEDLASAVLRDRLAAPGADFLQAAERVLGKNRELYRRLS